MWCAAIALVLVEPDHGAILTGDQRNHRVRDGAVDRGQAQDIGADCDTGGGTGPRAAREQQGKEDCYRSHSWNLNQIS